MAKLELRPIQGGAPVRALISVPWLLVLVLGCAQSHVGSPAPAALEARVPAPAPAPRVDPGAAGGERGFRRKRRPVDPPTLQALLPAAPGGLRLKLAKGETTGGPETRYT